MSSFVLRSNQIRSFLERIKRTNGWNQLRNRSYRMVLFGIHLVSIDQRDSALKEGASGAMIIKVFVEHVLFIFLFTSLVRYLHQRMKKKDFSFKKSCMLSLDWYSDSLIKKNMLEGGEFFVWYLYLPTQELLLCPIFFSSNFTNEAFTKSQSLKNLLKRM